MNKARTFLSSRWVNLFFFYMGWVFCLKFVIEGKPLLGTGLIGLIILNHLLASSHRRFEAILIGSIVIMGTTTDSLYQLFGLIKYSEGYGEGIWIAPLWVSAIWSLYGSSLDKSLAWLNRSKLLSIGFGATGGPFSYLAAEKIGAITFTSSPVFVLSLLAILWAAIVPLSFVYTEWLRSLFSSSDN